MPPRTRAAVLREANMARVAVFETVELLEQILLHLPMKDLLLKSRVCKHWQNAIIGSLCIQRALFMKPEPTGCVMRFRLPDTLNKISEDDPIRFWYGQKGGHDFQLAYLNPLLVEQKEHPEYQVLLDRAEEGMIEKFTALPIKNCIDIKSCGSWQRMYLTQPPETTIRYVIPRTNFRIRTAPVLSLGGVTMGEVIDSASSFLKRKRNRVLDAPGGLNLHLTHTRVVASADEMMLHERTRGKSNEPWTEEDMFTDEDSDDDGDEDGDDNREEDEDEND